MPYAVQTKALVPAPAVSVGSLKSQSVVWGRGPNYAELSAGVPLRLPGSSTASGRNLDSDSRSKKSRSSRSIVIVVKAVKLQ